MEKPESILHVRNSSCEECLWSRDKLYCRCSKCQISPIQEQSLALFSSSWNSESLWIGVSWYLPVWDVWIACPGTHPWQKSHSFCIKHECISYICLCANTCRVKRCKAWIPFETLEVEKKIMLLANTCFSDSSERIFSEKGWGGVGHISAVTKSSFGTCQVCLERSLNSAGCVSLAESSLSCSPGLSRFPSSEQGVPKGSQLCFRWPECLPWPRWLLSGLRRFVQLQCSRLAAASRAAKDISCQPEALRESQAVFGPGRAVVTRTPCGFCPVQVVVIQLSCIPWGSPEKPQGLWRPEAQFSSVKKPHCSILPFPHIFLHLSAAKNEMMTYSPFICLWLKH